MDRHSTLLDVAKSEMGDLTAMNAPKVGDINALLAKYEAYPDDIRTARDQLSNKKAMM